MQDYNGLYMNMTVDWLSKWQQCACTINVPFF